jgi:hypothetical protein
MSKGYTQDGRVTAKHPTIEYYLALSKMMEMKSFTVSRTVDGRIAALPLTLVSVEGVLGYGQAPALWVTYLLNGQEVCEKASAIDIQMLAMQAKKYALKNEK